jgi:hypothetical protein
MSGRADQSDNWVKLAKWPSRRVLSGDKMCRLSRRLQGQVAN